uniref:Uncharacterized protein n=1 Tax=Medicago truncatula TaxID=3880 RepID=B7FFZ7_MEDTR|nr:unknown [Medicago truncatula]
MENSKQSTRKIHLFDIDIPRGKITFIESLTLTAGGYSNDC